EGGGEIAWDENNEDTPIGKEAVARDRVCGRLAAVERDEPDGGRPGDPACGVPEQKPPPRHAPEPRDPGRREAQDCDEAAEEDGLAAVAVHYLLGARQDAVRPPLQPPVPAEERASAEPPDHPVAEVVADDRRGGGGGDHGRDAVVALRREHAEEDERRLAGQRNPEGLEHHDDEEQRQAMMREEMRHSGAVEVGRIEFPAMRVGAARETAPGERRVALVPETVGKLVAGGFDVVVEPGAGEAASFPDDAYAE